MDEPKRPEASRAVCDWIDARMGGTCCMTALRSVLGDDMPPEVRVFLDTFDRWLDEYEAWAKAQPIAHAQDSFGWRMFGGARLPWNHRLRADGLDWRAEDAAVKALATLGPERFRTWAGAFYEREAMMEASARKLLADAGVT